ncbi:hypothetical protein SteCoe_4000 [Stentor coeruleus]|uniref:Transmembrane protein 231 n=1 Tax=Stentor coeruleus TaxID=5963 RepID=A0A1R2CVP6_9CILI|nr:hypothetical protein SteCoe_17922 [Stentor coeruleus]OMJ93060.1 hypothetical protein SteCoe_4000 [Stentor coeruleus]
MAILFSEPLLKVYRASAFSCSFIFCWFLFMVAIILPFFLAFSTYDFWKKQETYLEQPKVLYRKEILVMIYTEEEVASNGAIIKSPSTLIFSSMGGVNEMFFSDLSPMLIKSSLLDFNFDNYPDMYEFNITAYTDPIYVKSVKVLTFYDYKIRDRVKLDMVGMAFAEVQTPVGASTVFIDGNLEFRQSQPLKATTIVRNEYDTSVLSQTSSNQNYLPSLFLRYNDRNCTTYYNYQSLVMPKGDDETCTISMKVRIPAHQKFEYTPGFLETMKFAWVQYLCLLIPVGYMIYSFASFVFDNQVLESHVTYETKILK